ncbi:MAG TPA: FAD-dependent oxidoreductase [Burkholderiales bacterium]|nr:FAD-dependent oxidoreductase [Burkholderiales bacterium]
MTDSARLECDVLVAGSGAGGLAAAITAAQHGLEVIVTEKEPLFGGTTAYSAGGVWIPCSSHARRAGVSDSTDAALRYLEQEVGGQLDRAKARAYLAACAEMLDFIERHTGVRFTLMTAWSDYHPDLSGASAGGRSLVPEPFDGRLLGEHFRSLRPPLATMMLFGGMSVGRTDIPHLLNVTRSPRSALHVARMLGRYGADRLRWPRGTRLTNGNSLVAQLAKWLFDRGVPLWLRSPLVNLVRADGRVTGAILRRDGAEVEVTARRGVVLACGGFPRDGDMRLEHYRHVAAGKNHVPLAPSGNTGDGIRAARGVGAAFTAEYSQPAAWTPVSLVPQPDGTTIPYPHFIDRCKPGYIAVDRRGRRFANEADSYHDFMPRLFDACSEDRTVEAFLVSDHRAIRRYGIGVAPPAPGRLGSYLRSGYLTRAGTPEALAGALGIDPAGFVAQLERYNRHAERGEDPEFGKGTNAYHRFGGDPSHSPNPNIAPIVTPPYYAVRLVPGDLGTFIGLSTDPLARVLDVNERPIPGLYAVGNDQASVMGGTYPGAGITIGPAMTFGYIAGRDLAG